MAFYQDLSLYCYEESGVRPGTQNIGWIDANASFPKGDTSDAFIKTLWQFCKVPVVQTRGFHVCRLCNMPTDIAPRFEFDGETLNLGSAEIRVIAKDGLIYAAPNLIFHYVKDHRYLPPQAFVDAVLSAPEPQSKEYRAHLKALKLLK